MSKATTIEDVTTSTVQWKQIWSLTALYASIVIGWIAYHNYQPKLLTKFNFTDLAFFLIAAKAIILIATPPVAGRLGDRYRFKAGHRLPIISGGISFAAMVFMAVAFSLLGNPGEYFRWILPVLIVMWLVAMSIFTSPALSTLELFTPVDKMPSAMAILTIVGNLLYALEPVVIDIIDYLGAPITFMLGGTVVFLSGYALKKNSLSLFTSNKGEQSLSAKASENMRSRYAFVFVTGIIFGTASSLLLELFPAWLPQALSQVLPYDGKWMIVGVLAFSAICSLPMSGLVNKYGLGRSFWLSAGVVLASVLGIVWSVNATLALLSALVFSVAFTSLSVSALPLAIQNANYREKVFCVGIFFSGVAVPEGVIEMLLN